MKTALLRIVLVWMAVLSLALFASCGGPSKTTEDPAENTPSASVPSKEKEPAELPSPPQLDVGTQGSLPVVDWND